MFTYLKEDGILFSSDAFGQHYATSERFDDEVPMSEVMEECGKYYANILYLFSPLVQKLLKSVADMNLDIKMIAPDHGIIWRSNMNMILEAYQKWSSGVCAEKALVIYDTMWHSTETMAKSVAAGLEETGVSCELINLRYNHRSDVMTKVLNAKAIVLGSPTLNNGVLPRMAGFLMYMRGLKPLNKLGAAFGSYGWSGEAVKILNKEFEEMKLEIIDPGVKVQYVPDEADLDRCFELGVKLATALKDKLSN
jgi:flavorubredoxin